MLLWLHVPGVFLFGLLSGAGAGHSLFEAAIVGAPALAASVLGERRRLSTIIASVGLMTASAVIVHVSGGVIEMHFHFFVMVGVIVLYEDWAPFLVAIGYVVLHHGVGGMLSPEDVYNHPSAWAHPWRWAAIHGGFILGISVTGVVRWRVSEALWRVSQERERQLAEAQEVAQLGSWEWEPETGRISWSDEQFRLFGLLPQSLEPTYEDWLQRVHPEDRARAHEIVADALQAATGFTFEFRAVRPDGSIRWMRAHGDFVKLPAAGPLRMRGTCQDVTEARCSEELRRQSEERYRTIVEKTQEGIWTFDREYRTTFVNAQMAKMLGYEPDEMVGRVLFAFIVEWGRALAVDRLPEADLDQGHHDCKFRRKDGSEMWALVSLSMTAGASDDAAGGLAVVTDITVRKQAERELAAARDQAMEASRLKSQFLANTSHEIRTPMTVIIGMNELLLDTELDHTQRRFVEGVDKAARNLLAIINDILDFSKIEAGKLDLEYGELSVQTLLDDVVGLMREAAVAKGLQLSSRCSPEVPALVSGDTGRLHQILLNLVSNGIKFTERGGVTIAAAQRQSPDADRLRFEVRDTGIGIDPSHQRGVFQPFLQVDSSATRRYSGTGLGLAISAQLVAAMGGEIGVDSTPGAGSTFWFEIPALPAAA